MNGSANSRNPHFLGLIYQALLNQNGQVPDGKTLKITHRSMKASGLSGRKTRLITRISSMSHSGGGLRRFIACLHVAKKPVAGWEPGIALQRDDPTSRN